MPLKVDENGVITEGRFKGYELSDVLQYAETLEAAGSPPQKTETPPQQKAEATPEGRLAAANADRLSPIQAQTAMRLEQDDERAFIATGNNGRPVADYEKYRKAIEELKKPMPVEGRITQGLHRQLYIVVKGNDNEARGVLFDVPPPAPPPDEEPVVPEEPPPAEPPRVQGKAAPPAAPGTPAARAEQPKQRAKPPKLVANERIRKFCNHWGLNVDDYLRRLEAEGRTQAEIDGMAVSTTNTAKGRLVYDRPVAKA